ncbi:MAG: hypothetical protein AB8C13_00040 [Phycisphaerales bacterium]
MANPSTQLSSTGTGAPSIVIEPDFSEWPRELSKPASPESIESRVAMGIGIDRPVIASGHQSIVFHPGIVSKLIGLDVWSKRTGALPVWIVPDQDGVDPMRVRVPKQSGDLLKVNELRISDDPAPSGPSSEAPPAKILDELPAEFEELGQWLSGYEHEASLARQVSAATIGLLCEQLGLEHPVLIYASDLMSSVAGSWMINRLITDPVGAVMSYNASVRMFPDAGVRELAINHTSIELPLWRIHNNQRHEVFVSMKDGLPESGFDRSNLAPRGLLMTAIMRARLCDLFIHGLGGVRYDQITEQWIKDWLSVELAPMTGTSATLTRSFDLGSAPQNRDRAVWLAHHARHTPEILGDSNAQQAKQDLVARIEQSKKAGDPATTARLFAQLHQLLNETNELHHKQLSEFDHSVQQAQAAHINHEIMNDRTWAFPLYSRDQLAELKQMIVSKLGG